MADDEGSKRVRRARHKSRVHEDMDSIDVGRRSNADLVRPPSASRAKAVTKASRRALERHDRERPTKERAYSHEFTQMPGERIDTKHKGEKLLVNLSNRARGAGVMLNRGQITDREFRAAERLCELFDQSQQSQLSGLPMQERVQGGAVDTSGARLRAAAAAYGDFRAALECLTSAGRVLVENVVVYGVAMEDAVRMRGVVHRMETLKSLDNQRSRAVVIIQEALETLADHFRIAKA